MKKILILYTSAGLGHKTMAFNLGKQAESKGFGVSYLDVYEAEDGILVSVGRVVYKLIYEHLPWVWRFVYTNKSFINFSLKFRLRVAAKKHIETKKVIDNLLPDMIVTTQTSASAIVAYLKKHGLYKQLFGIAFSDFHLHRFWLYEQADFYLANTLEQKAEMIKLGVDKEKIFVCGMSLEKASIVAPQVVRERLGVEVREKVVLFTGGSLGYGIDYKLARRLSEYENVRVFIVCGKNAQFYESLKQIFKDTRVMVYGYYEPMKELYSLANVFISKPGGLSVSEALSYFLPIIISGVLPGQEEKNLEFLNKKELVVKTGEDLLGIVLKELNTGSFAAKLKMNPNRQLLLDGEVGAGEVMGNLLHVSS
ncbi:MAG: hypothetical protein JNN11_00530 [Candidatus Doudnabacteria bacterium]|nr:hypothetical protein [Candidatus Doudnabacteria bacterium]